MSGDRPKTLVVEVEDGIIDILIVKAVVQVGSNGSMKNDISTNINHHLVAEVLLLIIALIICAFFSFFSDLYKMIVGWQTRQMLMLNVPYSC